MAYPNGLPGIPVTTLQLGVRDPRVRVLFPADLHRLLEQRPGLCAVPSLRLHARVRHQQRRMRPQRHPILELLLRRPIPPHPPLVPTPHRPDARVLRRLLGDCLEDFHPAFVLVLLQIQVRQRQHQLRLWRRVLQARPFPVSFALVFLFLSGETGRQIRLDLGHGPGVLSRPAEGTHAIEKRPDVFVRRSSDEHALDRSALGSRRAGLHPPDGLLFGDRPRCAGRPRPCGQSGGLEHISATCRHRGRTW